MIRMPAPLDYKSHVAALNSNENLWTVSRELTGESHLIQMP